MFQAGSQLVSTQIQVGNDKNRFITELPLKQLESESLKFGFKVL